MVLSSLVFGFTTLIGWSYYGQICMEFLFGIKVVRPYRISFVILLMGFAFWNDISRNWKGIVGFFKGLI